MPKSSKLLKHHNNRGEPQTQSNLINPDVETLSSPPSDHQSYLSKSRNHPYDVVFRKAYRPGAFYAWTAAPPPASSLQNLRQFRHLCVLSAPHGAVNFSCYDHGCGCRHGHDHSLHLCCRWDEVIEMTWVVSSILRYSRAGRSYAVKHGGHTEDILDLPMSGTARLQGRKLGRRAAAYC